MLIRAGQQEVVLNLLNNAIYAISEVSDGRAGEIVIACSPEGTDKVRIAITDNGAGISEDQRKLIFTPFFTTKPAGNRNWPGFVRVSRDCEQHDGRLGFYECQRPGIDLFLILPWISSPRRRKGFRCTRVDMQAFKAEFYVFDSREVTMDDTPRGSCLSMTRRAIWKQRQKYSSAKALKPSCAPSGAMS